MNSNLNLRLNEGDRRRIEEAAKLDRRVLSDWARLALIDRANEVLGETRRAEEPVER